MGQLFLMRIPYIKFHMYQHGAYVLIISALPLVPLTEEIFCLTSNILLNYLPWHNTRFRMDIFTTNFAARSPRLNIPIVVIIIIKNYVNLYWCPLVEWNAVIVYPNHRFDLR